jgi:hypothetical protein
MYYFYPSFCHAPAGCLSCTSWLPVIHQPAACHAPAGRRPDSNSEPGIEAKRWFCLEAKKVFFRLFRIEVKQQKSEAKMNEK